MESTDSAVSCVQQDGRCGHSHGDTNFIAHEICYVKTRGTAKTTKIAGTETLLSTIHQDYILPAGPLGNQTEKRLKGLIKLWLTAKTAICQAGFLCTQRPAATPDCEKIAKFQGDIRNLAAFVNVLWRRDDVSQSDIFAELVELEKKMLTSIEPSGDGLAECMVDLAGTKIPDSMWDAFVEQWLEVWANILANIRQRTWASAFSMWGETLTVKHNSRHAVICRVAMCRRKAETAQTKQIYWARYSLKANMNQIIYAATSILLGLDEEEKRRLFA